MKTEERKVCQLLYEGVHRMNHSQVRQMKLESRLVKADEGKIIPVPFPVTERLQRLSVHMEVAGHKSPQAIIDLGISDETRVRGWSGGARRDFFIQQREATPGYLAGPLTPGKWTVLLGAYQVPPEGCTVTLSIEWEPATPTWLKGDLHVHTFHSDGTYSPEETVAMVQNIGLDFVALTDHNTVSQNLVPLQSGDLIVIPGMELTTYHGHANLLGVADPLRDFRVDTMDDLNQRAAEAHRAGAKITLNHPHDDGYPGCQWGYGWDWEFDWIEVWNGPWRPCNHLTLQWWQDQLVSGRRLVAVGGSDMHGPHPYVRHGMPTNWVWTAEQTVNGILDAINEGNVFLSFSPQGPIIDLCCGTAMMGDIVPPATEDFVSITISAAKAGDTVRIITEQGVEDELVLEEGATSGTMSFDARGRRFCRVEVWRFFEEVQQTLMAALSNPIYFA